MTAPFTAINTATASTGASNAGDVPMLNASGILDPTLLNATKTTAGSAEANKIPQLNSLGVLDQTLFKGVPNSSGSAEAGCVPILNASGQLDPSFLAAVTGGGGASPYLDVGGWRFLFGTGTIPGQSGTRTASATITFPTVNGGAPFSTAPTVLGQCNTNLGTGARNDNPVLIVQNPTTTNFFVNINSNDANDSMTFPTVTVTYLAIGPHP